MSIEQIRKETQTILDNIVPFEWDKKKIAIESYAKKFKNLQDDEYDEVVKNILQVWHLDYCLNQMAWNGPVAYIGAGH